VKNLIEGVEGSKSEKIQLNLNKIKDATELEWPNRRSRSTKPKKQRAR
jgi:hypothetical protein